METYLKKSPPGKSLLFAAIGALVLLLPNVGFAVTASNNIITNTVLVDYDDTGGTAQTQISDSTDVTVELVEATPTIAETTGDQSINSGTTATYAYTITSNSNGVDTYDLTSGEVTSAGIGAGSIDINGSGGGTTTITVGATTVADPFGVTIAAAGNTVVVVPSDDANDGSVNGISGGSVDSVVIGGSVFVVASVDDSNGGLAGTSSITVVGNGATPTVGLGALIGEQVSFSVVVTPGAVSVPATTQTSTWTLSAQDDAAAQAAATDVTITSVTSTLLTVTKYVANLTTLAAGGGASISADPKTTGTAVTYWETGVTGKSTDVLSYLIVISNAGSAQADNIVVTDQIPAFTTYNPASMYLEPDGLGWGGVLNDGVNGGDAAETDNVTVYIYAGAGGVDSGALGAGVGGNLPTSTTTMVSFEVTID